MDNNEIVRSVFYYSWPGSSEVLNVFFHQYVGTGDDDDDVLSAVATYAGNDWGDLWKTLAPANGSLTHIELDVLETDGTVDRNLGTATINEVGTVASDASAAAVSALLIGNTADATIRGRKFVPGPVESQVVGGIINSATMVILTNLLAQYLDDIIVTGTNVLVPGVLSRKLTDFVPFAGSGQTSDIPAYQRRRKPNVGS